MTPGRLRRLMNLWPPYLAAGIHVLEIGAGYSHARVRLRRHWFNRNYFGTHFGGSLYAMTDPFFALLIVEGLGRDYVVWDKAAEIDFVTATREDVYAEFHVDAVLLAELRAAAADGGKVLRWLETEVRTASGSVVAKVRKQIYVRRKRPAAATPFMPVAGRGALRHDADMTDLKTLIHQLRVQRYLITGLLTLLPLWLTWVVFRFVLGILSGISAPGISALSSGLATAFPNALGWLDAEWVQFVIAIVATILLIYFVGFAANRVFGQKLLALFERIIARIPLAQTIYGGTKKLLDMVATKPEGAQRVVLVDFPHREMKAVGLVTRTLRDETTGREYAAVYVPTTPNPTSGYLEVVPVDRLTPTDWTLDQAMAFIISGGAIAPDRVRIDRADAP